MSTDRVHTRRPSLHISTSRKQDPSFIPSEYAEGGALTPDVQGSTSPTFQSNESIIWKVGKYLMLEGQEMSGVVQTRKALNLETQQEYLVKVMPLKNYQELLSAYWTVGHHPNINEICEIILDSKHAYVVFRRHFEDLHSYIRRLRRLRESEAATIFHQIVCAVKHCHRNGVVLRDLKLRKFVFMDADRTHLSLEGLEEAHVLTDDSDHLTDKHGCLAYVSPEILYSQEGYAGKSADIWSLGVVLYTMLVGQYPFHDSDVGALFKKIRLGFYAIPEHVSPLGKCLLRNLLRTDPDERLTIKEIVNHRWIKQCRLRSRSDGINVSKDQDHDHIVPNLQPPTGANSLYELSQVSKSWNELN